MHFQGIHHRCVKDHDFRASHLEHDRTEEVCFQMAKDRRKNSAII